MRALNGSTSNYLRGDGTWATPPNTDTWRPLPTIATATYRTPNVALNHGQTISININGLRGTVIGSLGITIVGTNTIIVKEYFISGSTCNVILYNPATSTDYTIGPSVYPELHYAYY